MAIGAVLPEMFQAVSGGGRDGGVVRAHVRRFAALRGNGPSVNYMV
jgi:hypothetical protein